MVQFNVQHAFGHDAAFAGACDGRVLNGMFKVKQDARIQSQIALVHQHCATTEQVAVSLQRQIDRCVEQWMPWADERSEWLTLRSDERLLERDSLVAR